MISPKEVKLFQQMADLTEPKCRECRAPQSCCSPEYCEMAIGYAAEQGITLTPTDHSRLPMMGPTGCIVAPHLRPLCTFHVCSINGLGFDPKDPAFTKKYFQIRNKIDKEQYENSQKHHD